MCVDTCALHTHGSHITSMVMTCAREEALTEMQGVKLARLSDKADDLPMKQQEHLTERILTPPPAYSTLACAPLPASYMARYVFWLIARVSYMYMYMYI